MGLFTSYGNQMVTVDRARPGPAEAPAVMVCHEADCGGAGEVGGPGGPAVPGPAHAR